MKQPPEPVAVLFLKCNGIMKKMKKRVFLLEMLLMK